MTNRNCLIDGCEKTSVNGRGWCASHYHRWLKHGDPFAGNAPRGAGLAFVQATANHSDQAECLIWPYGKNSTGYGVVSVDGRKKLVHRLVCEIRHGPAPSGALQFARHLCGNGHLGCCNPHHLAWGEPSINWQDAKQHGTAHMGERHCRAKLSEADVRKIRALAETCTQKDIARQFDVSRSGIQSILERKSWAWVN